MYCCYEWEGNKGENRTQKSSENLEDNFNPHLSSCSYSEVLEFFVSELKIIKERKNKR